MSTEPLPDLLEGHHVTLGGILYLFRRGGFAYKRGYHTHMWEFWTTVNGVSTFAVGRRKVVMRPDQGLLIAPRKIHQQRVESRTPCLGLTVHFMAEWAELDRLAGRVLDLSDWSRAVLRQFVDTMGDDDLADARRRALWAMLLNELAFDPLPDTSAPLGVNPLVVPTGREYALARRAVEHMSRWLDRPESLMNRLCEVTGYGESQLRRLFAAQTGMSPMEAFQRLRLEEAIRLLQQSSLKIGAIAYRLGFARAHEFNRFFRDRMKCTPTQFISSPRGQGRQCRSRVAKELTDEVSV